jgi:hypothetical protein
MATWEVRDLLLIPSFMFSESAVIKRPPLTATARRAGWVGCNIALNRVPADARIFLVQTVASSRRRTGVTPVSDLKKSEYGDRQDACPTQTIIVSPEETVFTSTLGVRCWMFDVSVYLRLGVKIPRPWGEVPRGEDPMVIVQRSVILTP